MNHYEAFKAFVSKQPADQPIDHTGGWGACAVGDYGRSIGIDTDDGLIAVTVGIHNQNETVWQALNYSGRLPCGGWVDMNTYGQLSEFLQECG